MKILAIDPGTDKSGVVMLSDQGIEWAHEMKNELVLSNIMHKYKYYICCEDIESMGMPIGKTTIQTIKWMGRFEQANQLTNINVWQYVTRRQVKLELCGNMRAKDKNVVQAIKDLAPAVGGGKDPAKGTKAQTGVFYGMSGHCWQALAVGIVGARMLNLELRIEEWKAVKL
jgi:Holliday junction resolvasome RuvABC endonuclease subunit